MSSLSQGSLWPESVVEYEMRRGGGEGKREAGKVKVKEDSRLI